MALTETIKALPEGVVAAQTQLMQDMAVAETDVQAAIDRLATAMGMFDQCRIDAAALHASIETQQYLVAKRAAFIVSIRGIFEPEV